MGAIRVVWSIAVVLGVGTPAVASAREPTHAKHLSPGARSEEAAASQPKPEAKTSPRSADSSAATNDEPKARGAARQPTFGKSTIAGGSSGAGGCKPTLIPFDRGFAIEKQELALVDCDGVVSATGLAKLSVLARLRGSPKPSVEGASIVAAAGSKREHEVSPGVRLLDPGLAERIHALASHYPDKRISVVSGYRPHSDKSLHRLARAMDIRISGVDNLELVERCRQLEDTGCGYYPNSSFIHVDVRSPGTGKVTWIDASGPGEPARYVDAWPPPAAPVAPKPQPAAKAPAEASATPPEMSVDAASPTPSPAPPSPAPPSGASAGGAGEPAPEPHAEGENASGDGAGEGSGP